MKDDKQQRQYQQLSSSSHRKTTSIPLFCLLALVEINFLCFFFCCFDIFSQPEAQGMNSTKYQLKPMKDVIGTNSGAFGKTGAGTLELELSAFLIF
jgi:hypothetical protein